MEKDKKDAYYIIKFKKIDTSSISSSGKKAFNVEKRPLIKINHKIE